MHSQAIKMLFDEHDIILDAIERVETLLEREDLSAQSETLTWFITFFREYGDGYHHHKEEDILFSLLSEKDPMLATGIVDELAEHHELFRNSLRQLQQHLSDKKFDAVRKAFGQYLSLLKDHIAAENDELFVAAEQLLNDREKESLYFSFKDKDADLGDDRKKEFETKILNWE